MWCSSELWNSLNSLFVCSVFWKWNILSTSRFIFPGEISCSMQNVINSVKGTALGVAEFLTPVLKVRRGMLAWFAICEAQTVRFCKCLTFGQIYVVSIHMEVHKNKNIITNHSILSNYLEYEVWWFYKNIIFFISIVALFVIWQYGSNNKRLLIHNSNVTRLRWLTVHLKCFNHLVKCYRNCNLPNTTLFIVVSLFILFCYLCCLFTVLFFDRNLNLRKLGS